MVLILMLMVMLVKMMLKEVIDVMVIMKVMVMNDGVDQSFPWNNGECNFEIFDNIGSSKIYYIFICANQT